MALGAGLIAVGGCGSNDNKTSDTTATPSDPSVEIVTKQVVRASTPGEQPSKSKKAAKPTSSATVSKGDVVQLVTQVPKQVLPPGAILRRLSEVS